MTGNLQAVMYPVDHSESNTELLTTNVFFTSIMKGWVPLYRAQPFFNDKRNDEKAGAYYYGAQYPDWKYLKKQYTKNCIRLRIKL
jgi:hypothetical protein